jgi:hypothetical protein
MAWQASTSSELISGSSSMGAGSALSRSWVAIPPSATITGFTMNWQLAIAASGTTYTSFASGTFSRFPSWLFGVSYVPTGSTAPNLDTDADDVLFLWVGSYNPFWDRNTINQAGGPAWADLYQYGGSHKGRVQLGSGVGGEIMMHIANTSGATQSTAWQATIRASYHS